MPAPRARADAGLLREVLAEMHPAETCRDRAEFDVDLEHVYARFPRVKERRGQISGTLSGPCFAPR